MALIRRLRPALGTFVGIECDVAGGGCPGPVVDAAFAQVARVERLMHPTRGGSDLAAVNAAAVERAVEVDPWTWVLLRQSQRLARITAGRFDPCLPSAAGTIADLHFPQLGVVVCLRPVMIDLGGIAKGFAVDRAIATLRRLGCVEGTVNAGGDVRTFGPHAIRNLIRTRAAVWSITLDNCACAVSDAHDPARPVEHRGYYDRTRAAAPPLDARPPAIVLAPSAAIADAMTKCVLLCRDASEQRTLRAALARVAAKWIDVEDLAGNTPSIS